MWQLASSLDALTRSSQLQSVLNQLENADGKKMPFFHRVLEKRRGVLAEQAAECVCSFTGMCVRVYARTESPILLYRSVSLINSYHQMTLQMMAMESSLAFFLLLKLGLFLPLIFFFNPSHY